MADKQNSINYFGLEDWWERTLTPEERTLLDRAYGEKKSRPKQGPAQLQRDRYMDVAFLSDLFILVNKESGLQAKIVDKLMERYGRLPAPNDLVDDALVELHHTQIRLMNYFYGQRNYSSQAFDMVLRIAQDNINIEARVMRLKRDRIKRAAERTARTIEDKALEAQRKGDVRRAAELHLEARKKRVEGMHQSCAYSEEHPCFRQLAIIAEKNNDFDLALRIAVDARRAGWIDRNEDWTRRVNRLMSKISERDKERLVEDPGPFDGYLGAFSLTGFFRTEFAPEEQELIINALTDEGKAKHPLIDGTASPDGHTARTVLVMLARTAVTVLPENDRLNAHLDAIQSHLDRYPADADGDMWERHLTMGERALECLAVVQNRARSTRPWAGTVDPLEMLDWYTLSAIEFEEIAREEFNDVHRDASGIEPTHTARSAILFLAEAMGLDEDVVSMAKEGLKAGWAGPWEAILARHQQ
ncbi:MULTISPECIES: hypothetical protein [unclassified Corynebacterium]|uniref:hypothetical protein n=1 Tax=unclassified Corynebacterium TaxID=2624378 RepID=UPI00264BDC5F|nr:MULTISPECIES: hypothetical protein [unclassified Corynebacterium]MDN8594024.1 hypothetical protein [Corynebacterium sp. P4_F2]WKK54915.1 hypothetical protein QYR03_06665 [Corynebacterium sp. P4-C1]WKK64310.1 hypothetical protein QYR04_05385 [Corynebacterium sp. P8-C1]